MFSTVAAFCCRSSASAISAAVRQFKIHRATVSAHLHREGIDTRYDLLAVSRGIEVVRLYGQDWSLAQIGGALRSFAVDGT
jgi:hypothetical protein